MIERLVEKRERERKSWGGRKYGGNVVRERKREHLLEKSYKMILENDGYWVLYFPATSLVIPLKPCIVRVPSQNKTK